MKKYTTIVFAFLLTCALSAQKISEEVLHKFEQDHTVDCIIVLQDQLDMYGETNGLSKDQKAAMVYNALKSHAQNSQKHIQEYMKDNEIAYKSFFAFNGIQALLTLEEAQTIVAQYDVQKIVYNIPTKIEYNDRQSNAIATSRVDAEWGISKIKADTVWEMGYRGAGVIVAGQDTGYDFDNPYILTKYKGYSEDTVIHDYHWHDAIHELNPDNNDPDNDPNNNPCGLDSPEPCDDHAHGSHTMGTMVGGNDTIKIGVAPDAKWIACRNMERGIGTPATYTECYEWFLAPTDLEGENPDPTKAPHVINNSWGCPPEEGCNPENFFMMETVVNNLTAAGTVVVVSAGNSGSQGCGSIDNPSAIFENSFVVGASRPDDTKAGFSSIGPVLVDGSMRIKPDVVAPGVNVKSINNTGGFNSWGGTSMAGPHVAGAVALIISANPYLAGQVDMIKDILRSTAVTLVDSTECNGISALDVPNFYFGYGRIDVLAAVEMALNIPCEIDAGEDAIVCNPLDPTNDSLDGQSITTNIESIAWSSKSTEVASNVYHGSDMMNDTTILNPILTDHFDLTEVYYLTGTTGTGVTCIDSVTVNFGDWQYLTIQPESSKSAEDTVQIYSIASSAWPMTYAWSPDYNISDVSVAQPRVWNDTTQYYSVVVTDEIGCVVENGWMVNVLPSSTSDHDKHITLDIFPNPNKGTFSLSSKNGNIESVDIIDASGKLVQSISGNSHTMEISMLAKGVYLYRAKVGKYIATGRVVVIE